MVIKYCARHFTSFSWFFEEKILNFWWKWIFSHCFQLPEFLNNNLRRGKTDFEFSKNSPCLINDLERLSEISSYILPCSNIPRHFRTIIGQVLICFNVSFLLSFQMFTYVQCITLWQTLDHLHNRFISLTWIYFKGYFYCLVHIKSIAALTQLFFGHFLTHVCRPQSPQAGTCHVFVSSLHAKFLHHLSSRLC